MGSGDSLASAPFELWRLAAVRRGALANQSSPTPRAASHRDGE